MIDPRVTEFLRTLPPQLDFDVPRFRAALDGYRRHAGPARELHRVDDLKIPDGPAVRIYRPDDAAGHPVLVYLHGGAFVRGDLDAADVLCREVAARGPAVVVSVDYRLAPEHPHPAALDDARAAVAWTFAKIAAYGGDPAAISVGGDSAGANLATLVATELGEALRCQILISGVFDLADRLAPLGHVDVAADQERLDWIGELYATGRCSDPLVSPLRRKSFHDRPPALVVTSGLDPFVAQARRYAAALTADGAAVELVEFPGLPHGFANLAGVFTEEAHRLYERVADTVRGDRFPP